MPYDKFLAERIRNTLKQKVNNFGEMEMMGGICFLVDDKMCVGVVKDMLMARIGPDAYPAALARKGCRPMDFTKKVMKGYVYLEPEGIDMDAELAGWIQLALDFNPQAKSSKKKK